MSFATPSTPTGVDLNELLGALLYVKVNEFTPQMQTSFGPTDVVGVDLAVLDGAKKGDALEDVLIFPKVLVSSLKKYAGTEQIVLGRLTRGTAKPGQSAPWILQPPTEADIAVGLKYQEYAKAKAAEQESPF